MWLRREQPGRINLKQLRLLIEDLLSDTRKLMLLFAAVFVLRLIGAGQAPLLSGEAYYWLWGQYPDFGYYDHPPMVAWEAAALGGWILGSPVAARLGAIVFGAFAALAFWWMARGIFPEGRTAARATALYLVIPIFHLNGIVLMPDNGLILFMTIVWGAFWRAAERWRGGGDWALGLWLLAGAAAGAALLSKFHAWVMLPPLFAFLLVSRDHRHTLLTPGPWLAVVAALLVLSPNLIWNARLDWVNYAYQWRRSDIPEYEFNWQDPAIFIAGFLLTLTPPFAVAVVWAIGRFATLWRRGGGQSDEGVRTLFLFCAGAPLVMFLGALSILVTISMHWPAAGYAPLMLMVVGFLETRKAGLYRGLFACAFGATLLMHAAAAALPIIPVSWPLVDRIHAKSTGLTKLAERVRLQFETLDAANGDTSAMIMGKSWHSASLLAFYSERPRDTFVYVDADAHNFRFWMKDRGGLAGADAIVVLEFTSQKNFATWHEKTWTANLYFSELFESVEFLEALACYQDGAVARLITVNPTRPVWREFHIFRCRNFQGRLADRLP